MKSKPTGKMWFDVRPLRLWLTGYRRGSMSIKEFCEEELPRRGLKPVNDAWLSTLSNFRRHLTSLKIIDLLCEITGYEPGDFMIYTDDGIPPNKNRLRFTEPKRRWKARAKQDKSDAVAL